MRNKEHDLQVTMIKWFRLQYPGLAFSLFSVPNGANTSQRVGAYMKAEGLTSGVSDLIFYQNGCVYFIEVKTDKGRQNDNQKLFEKNVVKEGLNYYIVRSLDEFMSLINGLTY